MSMINDDFKDAGKELGGAFKTFGKTFVRTVGCVAGKISDKLEDKPEMTATDSSTSEENASCENTSGEANTGKRASEKNVLNDGSWKKVGRDLGHAFKKTGAVVANELSELARKGREDDSVKNASENAGQPDDVTKN